MALGKKQSAGPITIAITATDIIILTGLEGAMAVAVRLSGGSNATNALASGTFALGDAGIAQGGNTGSVLVTDTTITNIKTNGTLPSGNYFTLIYQPGGASTQPLPIPFPNCAIRLTMATTLSNTVLCEFWPVFQNSDAKTGYTGVLALPA